MTVCVQLSNWRLLHSRVTLLSSLLYDVYTDCTGSGLSVEAVVKVRWKEAHIQVNLPFFSCHLVCMVCIIVK